MTDIMPTVEMPTLPPPFIWDSNILNDCTGLGGPYEVAIIDPGDELPLVYGYGDDFYTAAMEAFDYLACDDQYGPYFRFEREWDSPKRRVYMATGGF